MIRFGEAADKNSDEWKMGPHRQIHVKKGNLMDFPPLLKKPSCALKGWGACACVLHASPNCRSGLCSTAKMWNVAIKSRNIGHEFTAETWGSDFPVNSGEFGGRHDVSCCLVCKLGDIKVDFENWKGNFAQHIFLMLREKSHQQFAKYVFSFKSHAQKTCSV